MADMEELVHKYHNLSGNTIREKTKNLNFFLNEAKSKLNTQDELNALISAIVPENVEEDRLTIDVLSHFGKYDRLLSVLKRTENPILIRKILRCSKFFGEAFETVDADQLVNDVLPNTSFSTRTKVINRLSKNLKNENLADGYFKAIDDKYGLKAATVILPACTLGLIEDVVTKHSIVLSRGALMKIVKKQKEFLSFYFEVLRKIQNFNYSTTYALIIRYIARIDVKLFWTLYDKYELDIKFGRHATTSLVENKMELLKHHDKCNNFATKQICNIVRRDDKYFSTFLKSFYPKSVQDFKCSCMDESAALNIFLKHMPKSKRYDLLNGYFKESYERNLHDDPEFVNEYVLSIMPEKERDAVLEIKVPTDEELIYLFNAKKCISALKDRIKHTTNFKSRNKYILLLYKTCEFNKDEAALLDVLEYVFSRHKNDSYILNIILGSLNGWGNLEKLSSEHWNCINEIVNYLTTSEYKFFPHRKTPFLEKYLMHLHVNNRPIEDQMKLLFDFVFETQHYVRIFDTNPMYEKMCLVQFDNLVSQISDEQKLTEASMKLLTAVVYYNKKIPKDTILITNYMHLYNAAKRYPYFFNDITVIKYCIEAYELEEFVSLYWESYDKIHNFDLDLWHVDKKPEKFVENVDLFLKHNNYKNELIDDIFSKLHVNLPNSNVQLKLMKYVREIIQKGDYEKGKCAVRALSHVATCWEYFDTVESLYPSPDGKIDIQNVKKKLMLQDTVIKCLINLKKPSETLPTLLKFCKGDYFSYALTSMYELTIHTREKNLSNFFHSLYEANVPGRKHIIVLTKMLSSKETVYHLLQQESPEKKHSSLQKTKFKKTLEYFVENPSENFWNLFRKNLSLINDEDVAMYDYLRHRINNIPRKYLPEYITIVYDRFTKNPDRNVDKKKYQLLESISDYLIATLDVSILKAFIKETLFNSKMGDVQSNFCFKCIFGNSGERRTNLFDCSLELLRKFVEIKWTGLVYGETRRTVYDFVVKFCVNAIKSKEDVDLVETFSIRFTTMLKSEEALTEFLLLEFTFAYLSIDSGGALRKFGVKANEILEKSVGRYGLNGIHLFSESLCKFLFAILKLANASDEFQEFVKGFTCSNLKTQTYIATFQILQNRNFGTDGSWYGAFREKIRQCADPVVKHHYKRLLIANHCFNQDL